MDRSRINFEKSLIQPSAFLPPNVIVQPDQPPERPPRPTSPQVNSVSGQSESSSSRASTPPKSMKKRAAPKPPAINHVKSTNSSRDPSPSSSNTHVTVANHDDVDAIQTVTEHNRKQLQKQ